MKCPIQLCFVASPEPDDIAVHLAERHGWSYDDARVWLKNAVEQAHPRLVPCQCQECQWSEAEMRRGNYAAHP